MIHQFKSKQFVAFLLTSGFAAAVNFFSRILYSYWVDFSIAILAAYLTGMITAYILAKLFVFKQSTQTLHRSVMYFILVNIVAVTQTWSISICLADYVFPALDIRSFAREIAHGVGVVFPAFTSYLGHKYFSFR